MTIPYPPTNALDCSTLHCTAMWHPACTAIVFVLYHLKKVAIMMQIYICRCVESRGLYSSNRLARLSFELQCYMWCLQCWACLAYRYVPCTQGTQLALQLSCPSLSGSECQLICTVYTHKVQLKFSCCGTSEVYLCHTWGSRGRYDLPYCCPSLPLWSRLCTVFQCEMRQCTGRAINISDLVLSAPKR